MIGLMKGLLKGGKKLKKWFKKTAKSLINRAKKDIRKLKGQPPKLSSWQIIELLAS